MSATAIEKAQSKFERWLVATGFMPRDKENGMFGDILHFPSEGSDVIYDMDYMRFSTVPSDSTIISIDTNSDDATHEAALKFLQDSLKAKSKIHMQLLEDGSLLFTRVTLDDVEVYMVERQKCDGFDDMWEMVPWSKMHRIERLDM